ncbi:hypothetical protein [Bacteroides sp. 51]|uniref:hypothetical protein n=1 Tax=Bacteroides sp. 51 TaxID=2302938 RepID=UPI0013D5160D|nr:hypothetical protein [Bacteroides sp. 51]NDV83851.1 hypothetical protein [Bacteroides sp. 51]
MIVRFIIPKTLFLLTVVIGLWSCTNEVLSEAGGEPANGNALVRLDVRISGNTVPASRALHAQHENEVSGIVVFAFDKGSDNQWNTHLRHVGKSVAPPQGTGTTKQFTVELHSGEWDLWVLANSEDIIHTMEDALGMDIYSKGFLDLGFNKSALQTALIHISSGKWNVNPNDANSAYRIPMWGMLNAARIETSSTSIVKTVNLYRMLAKIDVEVQRTEDPEHPTIYPGIPMEEFELTYVSLHNYNRTGRLIPGVTATDGNWADANGGAAFRASLPANPNGVYGWQPNERLEWSSADDFTIPSTALNGVIYTVEASSGTDSNNRPCIIIGGKYNASSEITYYRADFLDTNREPLDLLRNHRYKLLIRKISGKGSSSVKDAYQTGPTNLEAEVIEWNEGGYLEGVWNGTHEIRFSGIKAHFTQFGTPSQHEIKIRTNVPTLTFENFTDFAPGQGDGIWQTLAENHWSNRHFSLKAEKVATVDKYSDYILTITAAPVITDDPARQSTFTVKGYMLEVEMTISQDKYSKYQLQTFPNPTLPISIDGTRQLVKIEVASTQPYMVDFMNAPMFLNVYEDAAGTRPVADCTNIPASVTEIYIEVGAYLEFQTRLGDFLIRHVSTESTSAVRMYRILQTSPLIMAALEDGGYSGNISKQGGSVLLFVYSNLVAWRPELTIDGMLYEGDLSNYFSIVNGFQSQYVVFTAPGMLQSETNSKVYSIQFKGVEAEVETTPAIIITQKSISGTPPVTGVKGPENILVVNAEGELNLDGDGYIVYFKWGSLVGIQGSPEPFNSSHIAWAPAEYNISAIGDDWNKVQYATTTQLPPTIPSTGFGDPCTLASKNGVKGGWMMPTAVPWFDPLNTNTSGWVTRQIQGTSVMGRLNQNGTMFYPAAGKRLSEGVSEKDTHGYYWINASTGLTVANAMSFSSSGSDTGLNRGRAIGFPIRCVQKK